jgi:probable O-glycosylation ligase (exosortase A-associated)
MKGLIFIYVMTYGGALVSLFNPFIGLLLYVSFAIIKPEAMWFWAIAPGNYSRIIALALLTGWMFQAFGSPWRFGRAGAIAASFTGFWLWAVMAAPFAGNQPVAWVFVETIFKILLPFLVGMTLLDSYKRIKALAWVIVASQGYLALDLNLSYVGGFNRVVEAGFGGMDNNSVAIGMVTGVGLAFFLGMSEKVLWRKGLAYLSALLMAHVVLFSMSRGGMLALIITGAVGFALTPRQSKSYATLAVAVLLILQMAGPSVRQRFITVFADKKERDESADSRLRLWADNWDLMKKYPVFGVGPHQWPEVAKDYGWPKGKEGHSLWLQTGAELGFPGLAMLAMFYVLCMIRLWPMAAGWVKTPDPELADVGRMVFPALLGFAVAAQFVSLTFLEVPYYVALLGAGGLKLASVPAASPSKKPARRPTDSEGELALDPVGSSA